MQVEPARVIPHLLEFRGQLEGLVQQMVERAGSVWSAGGDTATLVRGAVALFRQQATPEAGAAKKKNKPKKENGISKKAGGGAASFVRRRFGDRSFFDGGFGGGVHDY